MNPEFNLESIPEGVAPSDESIVTDVQAASQDQMKSSLDSLVEKLREKNQGLQSTTFANRKMSSQERMKALRAVFEILESAGVDPSNPESVRMFLDDMKMKNPELYAILEPALEKLLGGENPAPVAEDTEMTAEAAAPVASFNSAPMSPPEAPTGI